MIGGIFAILILFLTTSLVRPKYVDRIPDLARAYQIGVFFRIIGTTVYLIYALYFSGGAVDAFVYDNYAAVFADYFARFDFSPFTDQTLWRNGQLFYTNFVAYPAAIFMLLTFNSMFGIYLLFSLVCFVGLVYLYKAFVINYPGMRPVPLALGLFLFPALWFWTSTIGKDAFMFLGVGLVCYGISDTKLNYFRIAFGTAIVYAFRPPTAYMIVIALAAFFILNVNDSFFMRSVKIGAGVVLMLLMMNYLSEKWGIEDLSSESIAEIQQGSLRNNNYGTGALEEKSGGLASVPRGIVDVLARPFIWEIDSILALASAFEINFVLLLLFMSRQSVGRFLRESLKRRLSTFILAFVGIYILSVGLFENNIGLIARHRAIIFPFLFVMAFGYYYSKDEVQRRMMQSKLKTTKR